MEFLTNFPDTPYSVPESRLTYGLPIVLECGLPRAWRHLDLRVSKNCCLSLLTVPVFGCVLFCRLEMFDPIISDSFSIRYYGIPGTKFPDIPSSVPFALLCIVGLCLLFPPSLVVLLLVLFSSMYPCFALFLVSSQPHDSALHRANAFWVWWPLNFTLFTTSRRVRAMIHRVRRKPSDVVTHVVCAGMHVVCAMRTPHGVMTSQSNPV